MCRITIPSRSHTGRAACIEAALVAFLIISMLVYAFETDKDSDGDGLADATERSGWQTIDGRRHITDPLNSDTDGDGLSDSQEAGGSVRSATGARIYAGLSDPTSRDTDDDQLDDWAEARGWTTLDGTTFTTEPSVADSDGDGLLDGWEAGALVEAPSRAPVYALFSNPTIADSDDDGLSDAQEADLSLNPFSPDTDSDTLSDWSEVEFIGTAADLADTDGDGFDDAYEVQNSETRGLSPVHHDTKEDSRAYAVDFARGALVGDVAPGDSIAWLAGNLASGALGSVPVIGWAVGGVADVRDAVASSIRADWVDATYSAIGLIPTAGDAVATPLKVSKFLLKHPRYVTEVSQLVAASRWIPEELRINTIAAAAPAAWDALSEKTAPKVLLHLAAAGNSLPGLADGIARANHVTGSAAPLSDSLSAAEVELEQILARTSAASLETDVTFSTSHCPTQCNDAARRVDVQVEGVAHEAKWGYVALTPSVADQIRSDAYLVESGYLDGAQWHFFGSSTSNLIGPSVEVLDLLDQFGIPFTLHLPR